MNRRKKIRRRLLQMKLLPLPVKSCLLQMKLLLLPVGKFLLQVSKQICIFSFINRRKKALHDRCSAFFTVCSIIPSFLLSSGLLPQPVRQRGELLQGQDLAADRFRQPEIFQRCSDLFF